MPAARKKDQARVRNQTIRTRDRLYRERRKLMDQLTPVRADLDETKRTMLNLCLALENLVRVSKKSDEKEAAEAVLAMVPEEDRKWWREYRKAITHGLEQVAAAHEISDPLAPHM